MKFSVLCLMLWVLEAVAAAKPIIAVSIAPIAGLVEEIAGEEWQVFTIIRPGSTPVSWNPTPKQMEWVQKAQIWVKVGAHFEKRVQKRQWLELKHEVNFDRNQNAGHLWTSPEQVKTLLNKAVTAMAKLDPESAVQVKARFLELEKKISATQKHIHATLEGLQNRAFLVFHPSWDGFAEEFSLRQLAIETHGHSPHGRGLESVIAEAKKYNLKRIFVQPGFSAREAQAVAPRLDGKVITVDPLAADYLDSLKRFAKVLKKGQHL